MPLLGQGEVPTTAGSRMDRATVFTKTAKGITQVNQKGASLSKDLMKVLKLIDGKSNFGQMMEKAELDKGQLEKALNSLTQGGFARVFQTQKAEADPFGEDDFDFTAPGKIAMPAATQRVIPGAANDISELAKQHDRADADKKQREQAHEQARAKAKVEAESRAKLEAEAKARQQAEQQAMEQARRAKEAAERARAELEAKMREEEARKAAMLQQQAKFTVEQKAKEEEESRRLAELRVKAEREAKALAEARARAEAEAAAMAKARAEAEAAAKRQAAEASNAEAQMKARLKEEIEARIRSEMETLLRDQVEDKEQSREEMRAQIMAEARMAAKAELEERLQEERDAIARAEAEARTRAEKDASVRADLESKKRAEAEARAAAETEARMKAEEESRKLRIQAEEQTRRAKEMEARARAEAEARAKESEARAREQAEVAKRIEAERQAKYEAEARAKIEAEERERRERELSAEVETERRAKEEAETRARIEARARETIAEDTRAKVQAEIEGDMTKRAEIEGKAQAKAYMAAKEKAEQDEEERLRSEQAKRAREIAEVLRTRVEADDVAPETAKSGSRRRSSRRGAGSLIRTLLVTLVLLLLAGLAALHVVPLRPYTVKVERAVSAWLNDDVSISSMTFRLIPTPHLYVQNVAVGKLLDAKALEGRIYLDITTLLGEKLSLNAIELDNVSISNEAVRRIPLWGKPENKAQAGSIDRITLKNVKLEVKPALDTFNATLNFGRDGVLKQASLSSATWSVGLKPVEQGFDFDANLNGMTLPMGAPLLVSGARLKGNWNGTQIVVPEFEADALEGKVNGTLRINWATGVRMESDLSVARMNVQALIATFTKAIVMTGRADGNFSFVAEGPSLEQLFNATRAQGKFKVADGTISNVDLVAVMQSDSAGQRAGVTKFVELAGELNAAGNNLSYRQLNLQGGVLRGSGSVDVGGNGTLNGRLSLEIRSQVAQDRGGFVVTGNVQRPSIRRGG
jgi:hypothetical protein